MDGEWFPRGVRANGNSPKEFVPAWRHVRSIFSRVGASNATWVWCSYIDPNRRTNMRQLYPGKKFVDWTCLDGYNWGPRSPTNPHPARSFNKLFSDTYKRVTKEIAPRKPMVLAEVASSDYGVNKPAWIRSMFAKLLTRYPKVRGLIYFDVNDRDTHWPIETSPNVVRKFSRGIAHRRYHRNRYAGITASPIPPP